MAMARPARGFLAALASLALLSTMDAACAGAVAPDPSFAHSGSVLQTVQYGYGYGYGYRPYGYRPYGYRPYGYRPYGYYPNRRYYNNHFGPGAGKERHRTRLDYCIKQPSRC